MASDQIKAANRFVAPLEQALLQPQIPALNGLRAVSVLMVILYHFGFYWIPGHYGVVMFFVLSGFLITWGLLRESNRPYPDLIRRFYWRRMLRIFPAYYAYLFFLIGILLIRGREINWTHSFSAFTYWSNYYQAVCGDPSNELSHTWSLSIEEQFYLLWPFVFLGLRRHQSLLIYTTISIILAIWLLRLILVSRFEVGQGYVYAAFETRADALLVGCLLAILLHERRFAGLWERLVKSPALALIPLAFIASSICLEGTAKLPRYRDTIGFTIVPPLMAVFIVQLVSMHQSRLWRWTEWQWIRYLGLISYPLYLYQQIVVYPVRTHLPGPLLLRFMCALALTVLMASASYFWIEKPMLRFKNRRNEGQRSLEGDLMYTGKVNT